MATIIDKPKNVNFNEDQATLKSIVDSMNIDSINFNNPAEVKVWATNVKTIVIKLKSMIECFHGLES